jgi:GT2 family glycosyltransferase
MPPSLATVSVVITSHNEGEYLAYTVESLLRHLPAGGEILVVDDASTDGSAERLPGAGRTVTVHRSTKRIGACEGRNFGARKSRGEIIVFSDAHIEVPKNWAPAMIAALRRAQAGAAGPAIVDIHNRESKGYGFRFIDAGLNTEWLGCQETRSYPVPLLGAGFLAMRREVFETSGGFDPAMVWGMEDLELSVRLWTLGFKCFLAPSVEVAHLDRSGMNPYYQYDWEEGLHNTLRLAFLHFGRERLQRVLQFYAADPTFPASMSRLATGNMWEVRHRLHAIRTFDDDWYFGNFNMEI